MENSQQKVKFIPIFVEGRDEPVINRSHDEVDAGQQQFHSNQQQQQQQHQPSNSSSSSAFADSSSSSNDPFHNHSFPRPPMGFGDMSFGQDMHMPSMPSAGSIFDRAKDFPVRDFFNTSAARRSESPLGVHRRSQERQMPVHPEQQQQQRATTPQRSTKLPTPPPPQQQEKNSVPATPKKIEDSIEKIQRIQQSVMDLMGQVEQYDGSNPKEYVFLDEMLTQNLLKLDDIDAEGKENIKSARREAIKCINHLIQLLEMKRDEAKQEEQVQNQVAIYDENSHQLQPTSAEESLEQKISAAASTAEASQ